MPGMRRLTIMVVTADRERFHAALSLAAAQAALERPARIFLQGEAVGLLRNIGDPPYDERLRAAGQSTLSEALDDVLALGVACTACQGGLALAGMTAPDLPRGIETGGLVSLLADAGEDQLVIA